MKNDVSKFQFANVVVVEDDQIGVIVKSWENCNGKTYSHAVYVRSYNIIKEYSADEIKHFVYSKYLHDSELQFYE
jgi:hypothetical protein